MKKIIAILMLAIVATACSDDNSNTEDPNSGTLTVNGVSHAVNRAYIIKPYTGSNPSYDKRRFYIILTDGGITMNGNEIIYGNNIHQLVDFNLYTSAANQGSIENTTYDLYIPGSGIDPTPFIDHTSIFTDVVVQNHQFVSGDELDSDDMTSGQVTISQTGGLYSMTFSFSNPANNISGTFTGTLTQLPYIYED